VSAFTNETEQTSIASLPEGIGEHKISAQKTQEHTGDSKAQGVQTTNGQSLG